jgi:hypothetical protein
LKPTSSDEICGKSNQGGESADTARVDIEPRWSEVFHRCRVGRSGEDSIELLPHPIPIQHFNAGNRLPDNVKYQHPFIGRQNYIPMTRAEAAFWLGLRVKRGAKVVPAAATLQNHQFRHLCSQVCFALLGEKLPKLGCERRELLRRG